MSGHVLILITCGSSDEAERISRRLVETRLAAGVQRIPIASTYWWKGELVEDQEWLLIAKTRADRFDDVRSAVEEIHSYEVPPIVMIEMNAATPEYLSWIDQIATGQPSQVE
jgi:periplasmic divalent cation tolerance protein